MKLDDFPRFPEVDKENMLAEIDNLPTQLQQAWELGHTFPMPETEGVQHVIIAGMGGSAIGADLLAAYAEPLASVPITVRRDYDLPAWAQGDHVLLIASSHSGNTEETLSAFAAAQARGCRVLAVTTGGKLAAQAAEAGHTVWQFVHPGQPRAAVGYSFGLLLALFARAGWLPNPESEVQAAIAAMQAQQASLKAEVPTESNPAKQWALRLEGKWPAVFGSGALAPVARRWKGQISEIAKALAQFEFLPEADHNTLAGLHNPKALFPQTIAIFLTAAGEHPRNQLRARLTRDVFQQHGLEAALVEARGEGRLAQQWTALHLGDYIAYYLAMRYDTDPTPVTAIEGFKAALKKA
ncbi:MAG TPA: bifunctional phosphoglucose/phosphomannose isomerase [Chloroflexi bacterium]|nr:bifunctional phosphoglucose/phosphomannose isomerase [Chloroflexota bacterium]